MAPINKRRLPVGLQSFEEIRRKGYLYVDKTDMVREMVNEGCKYNYLSRPRRFGKSILVDTLQCYLEGKKELFDGLKIMDLETEWEKYPVIHLDMSCGGASATTVRSYFDAQFREYEREYGVLLPEGAQLAVRFNAIITTAYQKTGKQVVTLIDEYDSPLQHSWKTQEHNACSELYREVFAVLKANDFYEKFVFITGITKFTQISLFSVMNNLSNISFFPQYVSLCGITEEEIQENFAPELEKMGQMNGWTPQETHDRLKEYYDGYHFSEDNMTDIYNPYSLINALSQSKLRNFWASSGATSLLQKFITDAEIRMQNFEGCRVMRNMLETSDVTGGGAELFLYQSGYLTIKSSDEYGYTLGIPNEEVRQALYEMVLRVELAWKEIEHLIAK